MISDFEHIFMRLLAICMLSLKIVYLCPLSILKLDCLLFLLSGNDFLYILGIDFLSKMWFVNISSHSTGSVTIPWVTYL